MFWCTASALSIVLDLDAFAISPCGPWYGGMSGGGAIAIGLECGPGGPLLSEERAFTTGWVGSAEPDRPDRVGEGH